MEIPLIKLDRAFREKQFRRKDSLNQDILESKDVSAVEEVYVVEKMHHEVKSLLSLKIDQESKVLNRLKELLRKENLDEMPSFTQQEEECKEDGHQHDEKNQKELYASKARYEQAKSSKSLTQEELHRLMCVQKDLKNQVESLTNLNEAAVLPILEKSKMDLGIVREEVLTARKELDKAVNTVDSLSRLYNELHLSHQEKEVRTLQAEKKRLEEMTSRNIPDAQETHSEIDDFRKKVRSLEYDLAAGNEKLASHENEIVKKNGAREKLEDEKRDLLEKCELERRKSARLSGQSESIMRTLAVAQTKFRSVTTARVQLELKQREIDDKVRYESASSTTHLKQLNSLMSTYVKKKAVLDRSKRNVDELEVKLKDQEFLVKEQQKLCIEHSKSIENLKDIVNIEVTRLLERTNLEVEIKTDLEALLAEVSEKEAEVETWILETKKFKKMESAIATQMNFQTHILRSIKDEMRMLQKCFKLKRMVLADTKTAIASTNKRSNEFIALYESLEGEKSRIFTAISASVRSKTELQKQIAKQELELQITRRTNDEKRNVLTKERDYHDNDRNSRATLRVEITNLKGLIVRKKEEIDYQDKNIRNLKSILEAVSRDAISESMKNRLLYERNSILREQLNDKKSEIHSLLLRVNIQEETLKRGNLSLVQRKEDIHSLEIQCLAAERYTHMKKSIDCEIKQLQDKIVDLRAQQRDELSQIIILSKCIEDPTKFGQSSRWRELEGEDLDDEQLDAKMLLLMQRLDDNREQYLERDAIIEDLLYRKTILLKEKEYIIEKGRPAVKELEDCQASVREITRSLMALVSELSMYHATALQLEEDKEMKQDQLSRSYESMRNGQPPSINAAKALRLTARKRRNEEARFLTDEDLVDTCMQENKDGKRYYTGHNALRTTADPRPSTYMPDVGPEILKPFGNMAPFKAFCHKKSCRKSTPVLQANSTTGNLEPTITSVFDI